MALPTYTEKDRIQQMPLLHNEETTPKLAEIRRMFQDNLPKAPTKADLEIWLQRPDAGGSCVGRAENLAQKLRKASSTKMLYSFTKASKSSPERQWEVVSNALEKRNVVIIHGFSSLIGGDTSKFKDTHHDMLFLAFGEDFYVGFDPDITATEATQTAWADFDSISKEKDPDPQRLKQIIDTMILGTTGEGLGPLCRKYSVNKKMYWPQTPGVKIGSGSTPSAIKVLEKADAEGAKKAVTDPGKNF